MGETAAEPDVPDSVKAAPLHEVALVEGRVRVDDSPAGIFLGLAARDAVVAGGGVTNEPAVHGST